MGQCCVPNCRGNYDNGPKVRCSFRTMTEERNGSAPFSDVYIRSLRDPKCINSHGKVVDQLLKARLSVFELRQRTGRCLRHSTSCSIVNHATGQLHQLVEGQIVWKREEQYLLDDFGGCLSKRCAGLENLRPGAAEEAWTPPPGGGMRTCCGLAPRRPGFPVATAAATTVAGYDLRSLEVVTMETTSSNQAMPSENAYLADMVKVGAKAARRRPAKGGCIRLVLALLHRGCAHCRFFFAEASTQVATPLYASSFP
ncbi:hypothetical protein HPB50_008085 [Hyalomma asiaticum]|uniref:Uncharacterized protein n=1 Tax=Hyalomma asiaticum TaxID=266040 RepID=A0ACB7RRS5_HYAAI|nr:hypothetical protein HPB50_008085 [Hyalomma asiaticum]